MFRAQNKIIIVDDIAEHLETLSKQFHENGIGCRTFKYDPMYQSPLKGVRVAFFDINLNPAGSSSLPQKFSFLYDAIRNYVDLDNGPFAIIFWTSNRDDIDSFKDYVSTRQEGIPRPFLINCIDKHEFLNCPDEKLREKLVEVLNDPTLNLFFHFESKLSDASYLTCRQIYEIIPFDDKWGDNSNYKNNFEEIFSKIACSTLGLVHAKKNPDKAIYEALSPILLHHFLNSNIKSGWSHVLKSLRKAQALKNINIPNGFKESKLNSIFHIEFAKPKKDTRGAVISISKNSKEVRRIFGSSYSKWIKSFIPFKKQFNSKTKNADEKKVKDLINKSKLIVVEVSAACDYSQNNARFNKYICGVLINNIDDGLRERKSPGHSLELGAFHLNNAEYEIWLNLNFVFGTLPSDNRLKRPLFVLKKEIMDMVGNRYANHVSRIGITQFD